MKVVGFIIGTALVIAGIITGNVGLIIQGSAMIVTQAIVDLTMPKTPARMASEMQLQLGEQPRCMLVGETFTAGSLVDGFNYGGHDGTDWECLIIRLADHKVASMTGFYVNDEWVPYTGNGVYPQFDDHHFEIYLRTDTTTQPLPDVVLDHAPGWSAADQGASGADVVVCYLADKPDAKHPAWPGGRPRFGFVLKGALCYDPRKDDTVTGGSGPHRDDDPSTWEWSENAAICRYKWVRGVYANDDVSDPKMLLVGRGLTREEAPPENIIAAANACDEIAASIFPFTERTGLNSLLNAAISPDGTTLITTDSFSGGDHVQAWNLATRSLIAQSDTPVVINGHDLGVVDSRSFYAISGILPPELWLMNINGGGSKLTDDFDAAIVGGCCYVAETVFIFPGTSTGHTYSYYSGRCPEVATGFAPTCFFADAAGNPWAVGPVGSSSGKIRFRDHLAATEYEITTGYDSDAAAMDNGAGQFFVVQTNGKGLLIDKATMTLAHTSADAGPSQNSVDLRRAFQAVSVGDAALWTGFTQWDTQTGERIRTVDPSDWVATINTRTIYDSANNVLISEASGTAVFRKLDENGAYRVAGPIYSNQDYIDVEQMFATATAGSIVTREGSVELEPGVAKSVVATFTDDDLIVGSQVTSNNGFLSEANAEWVNTVVFRYVEPDQQWNDHAAPVQRDPDDIIADGKPREASIPGRLVRYQAQALRCAEINRRLGRLWWRANVQLGPRFCYLEDGDWVNWQSAHYLGGATKTFRVEAYQVDADFKITLTLRQINASVYADDANFELDQSTPTTTPPPPPIGSPDGADWTLTATTLTSAGASVPALEITGAVPSDQSVSAIIVEYWKSDGVTDPTADPDSIPWTTYGGRYPPGTTKIDVTGLVGGATYYAAVSYIVSGETGDRLVLGPVTVADLDVSGQIPPAAPVVLPIDPVAGTSYILKATDYNRHLRFTNAAGCTVIIPKNVTAAYPVGGRTRLTDATGADVTLVPEDGTVTLNSRDGALISGGHLAVFEVEKVATDEWDVLGDVTT